MPFVIQGIDGPSLVLDAPDLTPAQTKVLVAMALCVADGRPTTLRKVAAVRRCALHNAFQIVKILIRKGYVVRESGASGTLRLARPLVWRECADHG